MPVLLRDRPTRHYITVHIPFMLLNRMFICTLCLFCLLNGDTSRAPLLQFWGGDETRGFAGACTPSPCLPPVVVVLADDMEDVPDLERDARLCTRDQVVVFWVVAEKCSHCDLDNTIRMENEGSAIRSSASKLSTWYVAE